MTGELRRPVPPHLRRRRARRRPRRRRRARAGDDGTPPLFTDFTYDNLVDFYNTRDQRPWPAPEVAATMNRDELGQLGLSDADVDDLIAFLYTLTDGHAP